MRHFTHNHGGEEGAPKERQIAHGHPLPSLVHMIQVPNAGIHERLERRQSHALDDPSPEHRLVVRAAVPTPGRADDDEDGAEEVEMPLAPDARRSDEDQASDTDPEEMIAGQERHLREVAVEVKGEGDGVCGEKRRKRGGDDGDGGEDEEDDIPTPQGPIQGIIGVVGRLRDEDDGDGACGVVFEAGIQAMICVCMLGWRVDDPGGARYGGGGRRVQDAEPHVLDPELQASTGYIKAVIEVRS